MSWQRKSLLHAMAVGAMVSTVLAQKAPSSAPETFTSPVEARTPGGSQSAAIRIQVERYTPELDRSAMTDGLKYGGYTGFLQALRKAPVVGSLAIGDEMFAIRWAREQSDAAGRRISFVTDTPVYFIGGGRTDPKSRAGFQVAIVEIVVDQNGIGTGSMAGAARVKPDGQGGVVVEDFAAEPIKLTAIKRVTK